MKKEKSPKKIKKVMTVQVEKQEAPTGEEAEVMALNSLMVCQGWMVILRILDENIKYLEKCILEKIDPVTKKELTDAEIDKLRDKRDLNIEVKNTPQNYIRILKGGGDTQEINFDPFQTADELRKSRTTGG